MSLSVLRQAAQFLFATPSATGDRLDHMLETTHVTPLAHIAVTGPASGEAMAQLWRWGYERVEAARRSTEAAADDPCDVLLAVGFTQLNEVVVALAATRGVLRPGGVAVIDLAALAPCAPEAAKAAVEALGLRALSPRCGDLLLAARPMPQRRAA